MSLDLDEEDEFSFGPSAEVRLRKETLEAAVPLNVFISALGNEIQDISSVFAENSPVGSWEIEFSNVTSVLDLIANDQLNDIILIINYEDADGIKFISGTQN